jgi:exodeoxyribonuclease-3
MRIEHLVAVTQEYRPDILLLQETRVDNNQFPFDLLEDLGYNIAIRGQKTRNGVAIFSKYPVEDVKSDFYEEARYIEAYTGGIFVASVYVPTGQTEDAEQYYYKLDFLRDLGRRLVTFNDEIFVLGGDFNVAPYLDDTHQRRNCGIICSPRERAMVEAIRDLGFKDVLEKKGFTWWDYRFKTNFSKDLGYRLDHFYLSPKAHPLFVDGEVLRPVRSWQKPSDHAPILCELQLP